MHVARISLLAKKDDQNTSPHVTAPILKPTYDQKPETFFGGLKVIHGENADYKFTLFIIRKLTWCEIKFWMDKEVGKDTKNTNHYE